MRIFFCIAILSCLGTAQTFRVSGVVVDGESNAPLKRMRVTLAPSDNRAAQIAMLTGEDGTFAFNARQGKYALTAEHGGSRQTYGLLSAGLGFGSLIITGADQDTEHLVFRWFAPGAISGTVMDDRGEPVEGALVQLIRASVTGGVKRLATFGWDRTDDRGHYRFPLAAGTYYLAVTGEPWYASRMNRNFLLPSMPGQQVPPSTTPTPAYMPAYYPNATDARAAAPVVLRPRGEAKADFTLLTINGVNVHVTCSNCTGRKGLLSLLADGLEGVEGFQRQLNFVGRAESITGVPPGRYTVRLAGAGQDPFSIRKTIDVGASDVNVDLAIQPAPSVSGKVTLKNPNVQPRGTLYVRLQNETTGSVIARAIGPDGSFSFPNVAVAKFRVIAAGVGGYFASEVSAEGMTMKNGVIDVTDGASIQLKITASDETGRLHGFVMKGEKPVPGLLAVLAPAHGGEPYRYRGFQTDSDGSFDFTGMPAGDYILFAVDKLDLEYQSAEAVRPYLSTGKPVRIAAHGEYSENISLAATKQKE